MKQSETVEPPKNADIEKLLRDYHRTLLQMHEARVERGGDPKVWNRLVNNLQALHLQLRASTQGRRGISLSLQDENPTVRAWSAGFALFWDPVPARQELERLAANEASMEGFEAKITLQEFDAGRLNVTWEPKRRR